MGAPEIDITPTMAKVTESRRKLKTLIVEGVVAKLLKRRVSKSRS